MPEGPNIFILKELCHQFKNKKVTKAFGLANLEFAKIENKILKDVTCWGKHLLLCFAKFTIKVHLQLFGTYSINFKKSSPPRLSLNFNLGNLNFYGCSVTILEDDINKIYDWSGDIMNQAWDAKMAMKKMKSKKKLLICDALLDQTIFSGVGNIIKNEVLFRTRIHPMNHVENIPQDKLEEIIDEAKSFTFNFLKWERESELQKHLSVYNKEVCETQHKLKKQEIGKYKRKNYHCEICQILYN
jgi:endonuclease-8